ncbi:acyl-CoA dehydrogenase family protein [Gordonia sp. CPCC 205333]|uniref:acyl-CoA dehydrogenase family protein n=1 Tax=Gordonia sp. CPCC 205333 TaxID=3140790 RepID=UPI003AF35F74
MVTHTPEVDDDVFAEILNQINQFVRTRVIPRENEIMATDAVPSDLRTQAAEMGLFGYAIPQEWGGLGLDLRQDVEVAMELGYTSLSVRSMFGTNNGIAGQVLVGFGTDEQRARWLPGIASGDVVASFALTEPGAGSDPAGLRTTARADGDGWIINGGKRFITNAPDANLLVVFARIEPAPQPGAGSEASGPRTTGAGSEASGPRATGAGSEASGPRTTGAGIAVFLVPTDTDGVDVGPKDVKMGQEGSRTADITFTDARVGPDALVGGDAAVGYRAAMTILARGRVHIAAVAVGQAQRALDESVAYAATATQGGTAIGDFQLVQAMIADMQTGVMAGRALVREAATAWVDETDRRIAPSVAKLFCTEMVGKVADLAVQVHGGTGYMRDVPVERIYRDVRLLRLYEGTSEIQRLIIGGGLVRAEKKKAL